jgi:hypothetical protein
LFQYAAGRSLSIMSDKLHLLHIDDFVGYNLHNGYELNRVFNIGDNFATHDDICRVFKYKYTHPLRRLLIRSNFKWLRERNFVVEPHFNFWPDFIKLNTNCFLYGYWQSEKYFKACDGVIRNDFKFREPLVGDNKTISQRINEVQSISLHVRRGDYVTDSRTKTVMQVCPQEYYKTAIDHISKNFTNPVFFIFSDEIDWVKNNLTIDHECIYIDNNTGSESYRDMQLMSLCKHNIIANSSFSWWGAWLNLNSEKIVIAPKKWFSNGLKDSDLIPNEWLRL